MTYIRHSNMKSKLTKISDRQKSLRTILPQSVLEILNLEAGNYIEWKPQIENGKIIFIVTKAEE